ncbi:solute carrier family 13 member 2-like isoform X2 [Pomacea canaliculata]|nr:solute carrier family 13 member 2-like isoform X2 [Pomacea canaliculata]
MAVFWVTEAIPIAMTSLMPVFLLPMMGVLTARTVSATYLNDTSILFMGGLTVAIAIETWNLHRRIALSVMLVAGAEPRWLMLGMMLVTWFLSMWMSNTATTAMMLPIVQAVLEQIQDTQDIDASEDDHSHDVEVVSELEKKAEEDDDNERDTSGQKKKKKKAKAGQKKERKGKAKPKQLSMTELGKALSLAIAYSANVGGIGSLTGTGPNLVLLGQSQIIFEQYGLQTPITFASWLVFGLPLSLMLVFIVWIWLQVLFFRCRGGCDCIFKRGSKELEERNQKVRAAIRKEFEKLGPITFAQGTIMVFFGILVALWITRDLGGSGGWGLIFEEGFVSDSTPAVLTAVLFFVLPSSLPDILFPSKRNAKGPRGPIKPLLDWRTLNEKMPWSLYLLLGGGFAIAQAAETSGLSRWLGQKLAVFGALDPWLMLLIICYIVTFATEVTSNTAIATLMMPILAQLALTLGVNPLFFMFPTAITTSFAFMLPVATPPNAIVFAFGTVRVIDMVTCGFILNILCVPCLLLATVTWANAFFHFTTLPPEFLLNANISAAANHSAAF